MKRHVICAVSCVFSSLSISNAVAQDQDAFKLVPPHQVTMNDTFWRPRIRSLVQDTLPHAFKQTEVAQKRLRLCAEYLESGRSGPKPDPHRFNTSDLYKVMEGGALMIQSEPNSEIESLMDRIIDVIARAQQDDGYLYVSHICENIYVNEMGPRPYSHVIHSHELYNVGHLYEAAVAYAQATGKTRLIDVAEKSAHHINRVIFLGDPNYNDGKPVMQAPGHEEIELGLVKLYNYTGKRLYLDMAKRFLDIRGVTFTPDGTGVNSAIYAQQHRPVAEQTEPVGHAVRAGYLYAAMAEVDSLCNTTTYSRALDSIWHNIVDTKMHITGGLGAVHGIEGFGPAYDLPNKHTYLETCAAVANVFFNMRMFLKYEDAQYVDVAEIALLNNCLSGIGLDGTDFFYPNPLEADRDHRPRSGWFGTACCPSNIARLIPQISGYMYATDGRDVTCGLYGGNVTTLALKEGKVAVRQTTNYPYAGTINFAIDPEMAQSFTFRFRIPTWAGTQLVPGKLYQYTTPSPGWSLAVNGQTVVPSVDKGFAAVDRTWQPGDRVTLKLPMPIKANVCVDQVPANRARVAFSRGPLVYCGEGVDNNGAVQRFFVDPGMALPQAKLTARNDEPFQGLPGITVPAQEKASEGVNNAALRLIPYFAWSNRDRSSMITWIGTLEDLAEIDIYRPENLKFANVTASHTFANDSVEAIRLAIQPRSSSDNSVPRWTSWSQTGKSQWVEIKLKAAKEIARVGVYFYDDSGGVQRPGSWHIEVPNQDQWQKLGIYNTDQYSSLPDTYNTVHPARSLKTDTLRIVMSPKHDKTCVGILSVDIETK